MNDKIEKTKMEISSLIELIISLRYEATFTQHPLSKGSIGPITACHDNEIVEFIKVLNEMKWGDNEAVITISDIEWDEYGNCGGDELYPVTMKAQLLPGNVNMYDNDREFEVMREYIWYPN